jgi:4-amino-4-deoxy-L-arabinose transferase-like glycosyltransferase
MKNTSIFPKPLYWIFALAIFIGAFALRMVDINDLPLDFHPTRQLFSALKARGIYYQTAPNIPDWQREMAIDQWKLQATIEPEIVENLAVLAYRIKGTDDLALPRIFSVIFWMLSALFLFLSARKLSSPDGALLTLSFYLFLPYGVYASRSFQPDPLMMLLLAGFVWALTNWSDAEEWRWTLLAGLFGGAAILVKMVAVFFVAGAAGGAVLKRRHLKDALLDIRVWTIAVLSLLPTVLYFYYGIVVAGYLSRQFGGRFLPELLTTPSFYLRWGLNLDEVVGFLVIALAPLGLLLFPKSKNGMLRGLWIGYVAYGLYFNYHFSTHDYYQIPFILIAALSLAPLGEMLSKTLRTRRKGWLPVFLLFGAWTLGLLGAAWTVHSELRASDYRPLATTYREIGDQLRDEGKVVALTEDYGYRLNYWGWLNVTHFPSAGDLWYQEKRGDPQEFADVFEKNTKNRAFFVVTDFDEWALQDDLRLYLTENYPLYAEEDAYLIFDLR